MVHAWESKKYRVSKVQMEARRNRQHKTRDKDSLN